MRIMSKNLPLVQQHDAVQQNLFNNYFKGINRYHPPAWKLNFNFVWVFIDN